jgi:hypothetical protein
MTLTSRTFINRIVSLPRVNVDVDRKEEEDALEVILEDGRVQKIAASSVVLFSGQWLNLPTRQNYNNQLLQILKN